MKAEFLGDNKDHGKGFILETLTGAGLLKNLKVDPMVSDGEPWQKEDAAAYRRFLRLTEGQEVIYEGRRYTGARKAEGDYFERYFDSRDDIFFDPNTGISDPDADLSDRDKCISRARSKDYLPFRVITHLCVGIGYPRTILAYWQRPHMPEAEFIKHIRRSFLTAEPSLTGFLCSMGQGSYIAIFSLAPGRIKRSKEVLIEAFGPTGASKVLDL